MEQLFEQYDLVLTPTTAMTAPKLTEDFQSQTIRQHLTKAAMMSEAELAVLTDQFFAKGLRYTPFTQLANLTGQPAISLPTYIASNGLPLGIHFTAAKGREDLLFEIGKYLEQEQLFKLPKAYQD
jgi:amidase